MDVKMYNSLSDFAKTGKFSECPYCGSKKMNLAVQIIDETNGTGYGVYWCDECKKGIHLSRLIVDERFKPYVKPIPNKIK